MTSSLKQFSERFLLFDQVETANPRIAGSAYRKEGERDLILHLRFLPGFNYYIVPDKRQPEWEYIVFAGRNLRPEGSARYFCQVGRALENPIRGYIEVYMPDIKQEPYFLKLDPKDFHFDPKSAA